MHAKYAYVHSGPVSPLRLHFHVPRGIIRTLNSNARLKISTYS